jgi:hypothetical protein
VNVLVTNADEMLEEGWIMQDVSSWPRNNIQKPSLNDPNTCIACLSNSKLAHEKKIQEFEIARYWMAFFIHIKMFDLLIISP